MAGILSIAQPIIGCGGGNSNSSFLTEAEAQAIATAVSNGMHRVGQAAVAEIHLCRPISSA
jgi:hypothetical protein